MPKNITQYDLLISCPGDIKEEIGLINKAVEQFNEHFADSLGISIRIRHWSKSSYAQSGGKPQALLNEQFIKDCDAAIALFWTRFGTPTDEYGSGTEEEIEIMLNAGKQVFMFFSDKPISPSQQDSNEYARVKEFKEKYKAQGLYATYKTDEEFTNLVYAHLSKYFLSAKSVAELKNERAPQLFIRGIDEEGKLCPEIPILSFDLNGIQSKRRNREHILQMYQEVAEIHLGMRVNEEQNHHMQLMNFNRFSEKNIEIEEKQKELLISVADALGFRLPEDFFGLGNLKEYSTLGASLFTRTEFDGTKDEIRKYELINDLYDVIIESGKWGSIEDAFSEMKCVKLAIENMGTAVDEDIEVTIKLDKHVLLTMEEFPTLGDSDMEYMLHDGLVYSVFCIPDTAQFKEYESAREKAHSPTPIYPHNPIPFLQGRDYKEEYDEALKDIFCYSLYIEEQYYILKLKFDYIKHHTVVAFPTAIFLKEIPETIAYEITSRNTADVIEGQLTIISKR